jgi:hypothetical protein
MAVLFLPTALVLTILTALVVAARDRRRGHHNRDTRSIERATFENRNDEHVMERYGDSGLRPGWAISRKRRAG